MDLITGIVTSGALAVLAVAVAMRRPMLVVCLFLVITLSNAPGILVNVHGFPSIGILIVPVLAALLVARSLGGLENPDTAAALVAPTLVFFVALAVRASWAGIGEAAFTEVDELAKNLVILLVLVGFLTDFQRLRLAARTSSATIGFIAALSTYQYVSGSFENTFLGFSNASVQHITGDLHGWRVSGPLPDPNFFAQLLVMALPLSIALAVSEPRWVLRGLAAVSIAAIASAIVLTYSRGALLAVAILAVTYLVFSRRRSILIPCALVALTLAVLLVPSELFERVYSGIETGGLLQGNGNISGDPAVIQRVSVMRAAIQMFLENPVFGVGPGQFAGVYEAYALQHDLEMGAPPAAHSLYLEIAAEQGLLGLTLFGALVATGLLLAGRGVQHLKSNGALTEASLVQAFAYAIVGYLATAIFLHDAYPRFFWTFFALVVASWGIMVAKSNTRNRQQWSSKMFGDQSRSLPTANWRSRQGPRSIPMEALRRGWILSLFGALLLGGFAAFLVAQTPLQYVADAKLLYRFGREYFPITPTEVRRNWGENIIVSLDNALATELHLLSSYEVAAMAVDAVEGGFLPPTAGSSEVPKTKLERVTVFSNLTNVRRVQGATMLSVSIKHTDPEMAENMLDAFLEAYRQRRDALFHSDARLYFENRMAALNAQDQTIQEELGRLNAEYSDLEDLASLTEWSPNQPIAENNGNMEEIQSKLAWMEGLISQQGKRSASVRDRLIELERERNDWEMSRAYTQQVAPIIEVADRTPVIESDSRVQSMIRILSAATAGAFLVWGCFILAEFVRPNGNPSRS